MRCLMTGAVSHSETKAAQVLDWLVTEKGRRPGEYVSWSCHVCSGWHVTRTSRRKYK